ncbi:MAG TPA: hypothetical protein VFU23_12900, partial [Gemmatimonadales bacterium]|nr:hypothetical protein [Gemmatimonadales bacterium]
MHTPDIRIILALSLLFGAASCAKDIPAGPTLDRDRSAVQSTDLDDDDQDSDADRPFSVAVFGDFPYGQQKVDSLPLLIALINSDPAVERVIHLGDIKAGKNSDCSDAYFAFIRAAFDTFEDPLV